MFRILPGKRQWHRVGDSREVDKRRKEDTISDKTLLLAGCDDACGTELNPNLDFCILESGRDGEQEISPVWVYGRDVARRSELRISDAEACFSSGPQGKEGGLIAPARCHSWRGFKSLVRKQFMPFTTSMAAGRDQRREEMQHLRQRRIEGSADANVLGPRTNVVELRKMDAKIQDGIHKSVFRTSAKKCKAKENIDLGHKRIMDTRKAGLLLPVFSGLQQVSSTQDPGTLSSCFQKKKPLMKARKPPSQMKENTILTKLMQRTRKDSPLLLASSMN